jgi:dTDP-4-dehydrorhamnose 3,5-epimerase
MSAPSNGSGKGRSLPSVQITELGISGAFEVAPEIHGDARGAFLEWFRADRFAESVGHRFTLAQSNYSVSSAGTLRGIHFADVPPGQAKYVTCPVGAVLDVVVDVRAGSPSYGSWEAVLLDDRQRKAVYLGEGLGHAFLALTDGSVVQYLCSTPYTPGRERGIHPLDPDLGIEWPVTGPDGQPLDLLLSVKDQQAPRLTEAREQGILPSYEQAQAFVDSLRGT